MLYHISLYPPWNLNVAAKMTMTSQITAMTRNAFNDPILPSTG